jgi:hypothetical protein
MQPQPGEIAGSTDHLNVKISSSLYPEDETKPITSLFWFKH